MAGIEYDQAGFDVSDRVQRTLENIQDSRLKNYILGCCGQDLTNANIMGKHCDIRNLLITIGNVGGSIRAMSENWARAHGPNDHEKFGALQEAFNDDMTDMLLQGCDCKNIS